MASKTFKTSKAPTNKFKGGLDAITNGGIYATGAGKGPRKHRKRSKAIRQVGGADTIQNKWSTSGNTGVTATTVVRGPSHIDYKAKVSKVEVILGDESTYTDAMIAEKNAKPLVKQDNGRTRKVKSTVKSTVTCGRRVIRNKQGITVTVGATQTPPTPHTPRKQAHAARFQTRSGENYNILNASNDVFKPELARPSKKLKAKATARPQQPYRAYSEKENEWADKLEQEHTAWVSAKIQKAAENQRTYDQMVSK